MDKKILIIIILMFGLIFPNNSIEPSVACETIYLQNSSLNWFALSIIGIFIVLGIAIIIFLIGKFFDLTDISAWGKNEIWQVIASVILIFLLLALIEPIDRIGRLNNPSCPTLSSCDTSLCNHPDGCSLLQTGYYYSEAMAAELTHLTSHMFFINMFLEGLFSFEISITPLNIIGISYNFNSMFGIVSKITDWAMIIIGPAILSWIGTMFILCFASSKMFAIFLPLGLILRSFPSTRSVGGGLIALALGLYFVYPFMLNVNNVITSTFLGLNSPSEMINFAQEQVLTFPPGMMDRPGRELMQTIIQPFRSTLRNTLTDGLFSMSFLSNFSPPLLAETLSTLYLDAFYASLQEAVFLVMISSFVLTVVNIFITFTFIQEIGKFLGSDMNLAELVKLI